MSRNFFFSLRAVSSFASTRILNPSRLSSCGSSCTMLAPVFPLSDFVRAASYTKGISVIVVRFQLQNVGCGISIDGIRVGMYAVKIIRLIVFFYVICFRPETDDSVGKLQLV